MAPSGNPSSYGTQKVRGFCELTGLWLNSYCLNFSPGRNIVKGNFAFGTGLGFLTQFEDLYLKYGIWGEKSKSNTSGRNIAQDGPKNPKTEGTPDHGLIKTSSEN